MSLQFIEGQRGSKHLISNGYEFVIDKKLLTKIHWKCCWYLKTHCPGRLHTDYSEKVVFDNDNHNHCPHIGRIQAKNLMSEIKKRAKVTTDSPSQIVTSLQV